MFMTPDQIASLISGDPTINPQKILQDYLTKNTIVRYPQLHEHYLDNGIVITEQDMLTLLDDNLDFIFQEGQDKIGHYWQATMQEGYQNTQEPRENWVDGPENQQDQWSDQTDPGIEQETGYEQPGFGESPFPQDQGFEQAPGMPGQSQFAGQENQEYPGDTQLDYPGGDTQPDNIAGDPATEMPEMPAAQPMPIPDMVAQMMEPQQGEAQIDIEFNDIPEMGETSDLPTQPGQINLDGMDRPGPMDVPGQYDAGNGLEQPAQQTQPQIQTRRPAGGRQITQPTQMPMPQDRQNNQAPPFGSDGDDFTIDPLLNSARKGGMIQNQPTPADVRESTKPQQGPAARVQSGRSYRENLLAERQN